MCVGTALVNESVNLPYDNAEIQEIKVLYQINFEVFSPIDKEITFTGEGLSFKRDDYTSQEVTSSGQSGENVSVEYTLTNIPTEFTITD